MAQITGKRLKKMGYLNVGDITYKGVPFTIWVGSDPNLAQQSWAQQKSKYFPDYVGPPPPNMPSRNGKSEKPANSRVSGKTENLF
jgi:hypothetical protein